MNSYAIVLFALLGFLVAMFCIAALIGLRLRAEAKRVEQFTWAEMERMANDAMRRRPEEQ